MGKAVTVYRIILEVSVSIIYYFYGYDPMICTLCKLKMSAASYLSVSLPVLRFTVL